MNQINVRVSVRNLVEFVMMSGSIEMGAGGAHILEEGTKTHQRLQQNREDNYQKEVTLSQEFERNGFIVTVHGRCDGIIRTENGVTIEEIKSTSRPLVTIKKRIDRRTGLKRKCMPTSMPHNITWIRSISILFMLVGKTQILLRLNNRIQKRT
ncbi:hypothetical protein H1D32_16525 [Anaerobacillus sp. CMMVII]|uniref:hypothetical protein n=1 Tax=Anaerobacillus sp. CMMVII TaxID=2755588 RepID=UPI0021B75DD9|nr:hypothetical protein [Anaerobacillus sp. CMMVII]MCT8139168.1 hypothetical protein [Anaerobacillus sp. CMMVII]